MERMIFDYVETKTAGQAYTFAEKGNSMIEIDEKLYASLAKLLTDTVGDREYFNGSVEYAQDGRDYKLTATLMIYYSHIELPEGRWRVMSNIIPVWWEFSVTTAGRERIPDDFCFTELKRHVFERAF